MIVGSFYRGDDGVRGSDNHGFVAGKRCRSFAPFLSRTVSRAACGSLWQFQEAKLRFGRVEA